MLKSPSHRRESHPRDATIPQSPKTVATFDEANLISSAGLVPVMRLARRAGLGARVTAKLTLPGGAGCDAAAKVCSIVAGMLTGADSIADLGVLREGAVHKVLPGVKAPSTLGTFLRVFTFGHVRQLGSVAAGVLTALAALVPLLTGHDDHRDAVTWLDVDDTMRRTYGYAKQGVGYGYNKIKGLNALLGIVSTPSSAPIIVGHRLRKGAVNSARGAGKFLADAIAAARRAGAGPVIRCRLDSAFYNHSVVTAILTAKAQFSITARMDKAVQKAISGIPETAWVSIQYPQAIFDEEQQRWISDAQVAEIDYTAFTSKKKKALLTPMWVESRVVWRADQRGLSWLGARASRRFGSLSQHRALESTRARFDPTQSCPEPRRRDGHQRPSGQRARRRPGGGSTAPAAPSDGLSVVLVPHPAPL